MGGGSLIDFGTLFSQLISTYWWLLPLFVLAALFKSPWFKGLIGEVVVNFSARLFLDKNDDHLIKNVTIPTEDGSVYQKREAPPFAKSIMCIWINRCLSRHRHWRLQAKSPRLSTRSDSGGCGANSLSVIAW